MNKINRSLLQNEQAFNMDANFVLTSARNRKNELFESLNYLTLDSFTSFISCKTLTVALFQTLNVGRLESLNFHTNSSPSLECLSSTVNSVLLFYTCVACLASGVGSHYAAAKLSTACTRFT